MRIFPSMLQQYFVLLTYLKYRVGADFASIYGDLYNYYRDGRVKDPIVAAAFHRLKLEELNPKHSLDELIEHFKGRIAYPAPASAEGDLIDLLIEALNTPFANNLLTGKTVNSLRKSLMQPEELVAFKDRIRKNKIGCAGCGVEFQEREAISFSVENNQVRLYCGQCLIPVVAACPGCKKKAPFSERYTSKKWKDCSSHEGDKKVVDEDVRVPKRVDDQDIINWARNPLRGRAVRPQPAPAPRVPQPPPIGQFYGDEQQANQLNPNSQYDAQFVYNYVAGGNAGVVQVQAAANMPDELGQVPIDVPEEDDVLPDFLLNDDDEADEGN